MAHPHSYLILSSENNICKIGNTTNSLFSLKAHGSGLVSSLHSSTMYRYLSAKLIDPVLSDCLFICLSFSTPLRLLVVRLLSFVRPSHLTSLVEELEESVYRHMVTIVLLRRCEEPHAVLVAALPSRDLSWELSKLQAQGYRGPPEPSPEIPMCEGEQLLLRFSGNITSTGRE